MNSKMRVAVAAWAVTAVYYFYQYSLRSAPAVMMPQISDAFRLTSLEAASLVGLFYFGYSPFSLVAGTAMDRFGPKAMVPIGAILTGIGALLFSLENLHAAQLGRFLQGAGGVFALVGAVYIATSSFPASQAATLVGATQMFGMAGGSAGQFLVGPLMADGLAWNRFWLLMGGAGIALGVVLFVLLPRQDRTAAGGDWVRQSLSAMLSVFRNPQSILCGFIAGLLFVPTTILDMIWGVRFLQEAHGFEFAPAVMRSAMVPVGWMIGCPLVGFISDRVGRRKPVIVVCALVLLVCLAWTLFGPANVLPPYLLALLAGVASGAAMLPYTIIKEANPPEHGGTATGVINFLNFTLSALLGPVFGRIFSSASGTSAPSLQHYQVTFSPLLAGVTLAIMLTFALKETGPAANSSKILDNPAHS